MGSCIHARLGCHGKQHGTQGDASRQRCYPPAYLITCGCIIGVGRVLRLISQPPNWWMGVPDQVMMQRKGTVLIVDDDPRLLRLVRVNLESAGFTVNTASSGAAALEEFSADPPDAVVLDIT